MSKLKKSLGFIDGVALLVGITIGAGIFKTPQVISRYIDSFFLIKGRVEHLNKPPSLETSE